MDSKNGEEDSTENFTTDELKEIQNIKAQPQLYERLAESICPTISGELEIKKGILVFCKAFWDFLYIFANFCSF